MKTKETFERKSLTELRDEIIVELNELYNVDDWREVFNAIDDVIFESDKTHCYIHYADGGVLVSFDWTEEPFPLPLFHKIATYLMKLKEEKNEKSK